ncbi:MAG: lysylphosphatidylglycerol synthase domain-containing protein [Polyangiales bacterium]
MGIDLPYRRAPAPGGRVRRARVVRRAHGPRTRPSPRSSPRRLLFAFPRSNAGRLRSTRTRLGSSAPAAQRSSPSGCSSPFAASLPAIARGAVEAARTLLRSPLALAGAILSSVGSYVGSVFVVWMLGNALGLSVDGSVYFYAVPMVAIATLLPISLGGIGVRELGYFALLASEGVSRGEATALGVCQYTVFLLISAVAGIVWTAGVDRFPVEA